MDAAAKGLIGRSASPSAERSLDWLNLFVGNIQTGFVDEPRKAVEDAVLGFAELDQSVSRLVEQTERPKGVERPGDDVLGRRKERRAIFIDVDFVSAGPRIRAECETANLVPVGVGKLPVPDHGIDGIWRRWRLLGLSVRRTD